MSRTERSRKLRLMPSYTMRRTWPDRQNDYVFRIDGKDSGRCYQTIVTAGHHVWLWTLYGKRDGGMEESLAEAQQHFKDATRANLWRGHGDEK